MGAAPLDLDGSQKKVFVEIVLDPQSWIARGEDLLEAAAFLENAVRGQLQEIFNNSKFFWRGVHSRGPHATYCMLMAFALENFLKAALVRRDADILRPIILQKGILPKQLKTHELFDLMEYLDISVGPLNEVFIRKLAADATWVGRYPVPLRCRELIVRHFSNGWEYSVPSAAEKEVEALRDIVQEVRKILNV